MHVNVTDSDGKLVFGAFQTFLELVFNLMVRYSFSMGSPVGSDNATGLAKV